MVCCPNDANGKKKKKTKYLMPKCTGNSITGSSTRVDMISELHGKSMSRNVIEDTFISKYPDHFIFL
jgi:hypothetical protein